MNIHYVLYDGFISNSAVHVHQLANAMSEKGHDCCVAVPDSRETAAEIFGDPVWYKPVQYAEHAKINRPDIVHAWTPRENVRTECHQLKTRYKNAKLILHLEDNEESLLTAFTGYAKNILRLMPDRLLKRIIPRNLSHPRRYKKFLKSADGISVIMDTLIRFVPKGIPNLRLWPIVDMKLFKPHEEKTGMREALGIDESEVVIAYIGNVHKTNAGEVKNLYQAVAMANENGLPTRLIRTGVNHWDFLGNKHNGFLRYATELGYVDREMIPSYLAMADILIQPGKHDLFNDYRLPSKIPEFLSMGKPVVLPNTNIGRFLKSGEEALLLKTGDAEEMFEAIRTISSDSKLAERLSEGAYRFALKNFDKETIASSLERFYREILNG